MSPEPQPENVVGGPVFPGDHPNSSDVYFIEAALSHYDGSISADDVSGAWRRLKTSLLQAARAEERGKGPTREEVIAVADHLFAMWKNEHGLVCDARPVDGHKPVTVNGDTFCQACGETVSKRQLQMAGRAKSKLQRDAILALFQKDKRNEG